jgi:hypothetical protein
VPSRYVIVADRGGAPGFGGDDASDSSSFLLPSLPSSSLLPSLLRCRATMVPPVRWLGGERLEQWRDSDSRARLWRANGGRDSGDTWRRSRGIRVGFWSGREVAHGLASLISNQRWLEAVRWCQSSCGPWRRHTVRERGRARARLADWPGERTRVAGVEPWRARWLRRQGESSHDKFVTLPPLPLRSGRTEDKKDDRKTMTRGVRSSASERVKGVMSF